jgi:DNA repair protein RecO (recombination protein O)
VTLTTRALVLRRSDYGESHRMLLVATEEAGTVSAVARHARRSSRRFGGALEPFTLFEASLERKGQSSAWTLARARVLEYHEGFSSDVGRLAAGSYALELYRLLVPEEVVEAEAFAWLRSFLETYGPRLPDPAEMAVEELALLSVLGHAPRFDSCVTCGRDAPMRAWARFDHTAGGIVCRSCGGEGLRLSSRLRAFLIRAGGEPDEVRGSAEARRVALEQRELLRRCLDLYVRAVADREPRSMAQLRRAWGMD